MSVLKRLEELSEMATPRPWENDDVDPHRINDVFRGNMISVTASNEPNRQQQTVDALFIVAAVNALPDLLRVVRAAEEFKSGWMTLPRNLPAYPPALVRAAHGLFVALEALTKEEPE